MSLQVWLPFTDGTLKQQGVKNVSATAVGTVDLTDNGKLGKCVTFNGGGGITLPPSTMTSFTECSVVFWINITAWNTNWDTIFQAGLNSTPWNHYIFGILRNQGNYLCFTVSNGSNSTQGGYASSNLTVGEWIHLAFTYGNGKCKIYINGILDKEYSASITPKFTDITNIAIGRGTNGSSYQSKCKLNDFRIYDHCLSPMEVKELSKGLVLHYPLNRQGWGQENLIANTDFDGISKKFTVTSGTEGGFTFTPTETIIALTEYTVSCKLRGNANMNLYKLCTGGNESIQWVNRDQLSTTDYKLFSITFTYPSNKTLNQIYICTRYGTANTQVGDWFEIEPNSLKLERSSVATPWCPNSSDELATTMGLNSTTEYDCSGFCNNGIRAGEFSWSSDTPRYLSSMIFDGNGTCVRTSNNYWIAKPIEKFTVNLWAYKDDWSTYGSQRLFSCTEGAGFNTEQISSSISFPVNVYTTSERTSRGYTATDYRPLIPLSSLSAGWHMFTFLYTPNRIASYLDGELVDNREYVSYGAFCGDNIPLCIGAEATGNFGMAGGHFIGKISDFRLYYTELSDADILSLYQNSAYIDSSGNVYGTVHSEV